MSESEVGNDISIPDPTVQRVHPYMIACCSTPIGLQDTCVLVPPSIVLQTADNQPGQQTNVQGTFVPSVRRKHRDL